MSAQAGVWNFNGAPASRELLANISQSISQYGPDGERTYFSGPIGMLYRPFHTTKESRLERQPHVSPRGNVIIWDGRLDNGEELIAQLRDDLGPEPTDLAIVIAAFGRWGTDCFRKLVGDWALSIWEPVERTLILALDYVGIRRLYYYPTRKRVIWCSYLAPLVLSGDQFNLNDEYIAGYLAMYPEAHLTPYREIQAVPPGQFVMIRGGKAAVHRYWAFDPKRRIRYKTDAEYEEHFRQVFRQAVRRRLRSDSPVLAELSGGLDSSSIVCMGDDIIARGQAETPRLDTITYFDDLEPNWDDRRYFSKVEQKRGREGFHLDVSKRESFSEPIEGSYFSPLPGIGKGELELERKRVACMNANGNRVLLSGTGGDENLGGVPSPMPELADLLVRGRLMRLVHELGAWSLVKRRPWTHILLETLRGFLPAVAARSLKKKRIAPWLHPNFVKRHPVAFRDLEPRTHLLGPLPSYQANINTLTALRRQIGCFVPSVAGCYDKSYPYLDRDLLEYLFSIPQGQILRPGQRRSLMRRALVGTVPDEILDRKTKGYVSRSPLAHMGSDWLNLKKLSETMASGSLGFVDLDRFSEALQKAKHGQADHVIFVLRTLKLELWLQSLSARVVFRNMTPSSELMSDSVLRNRASRMQVGSGEIV